MLSFGLVLINRHQEAICDQDFVGIPKKINKSYTLILLWMSTDQISHLMKVVTLLGKINFAIKLKIKFCKNSQSIVLF